MESSTTPMHVGSVATFQKPEQGFDYDLLCSIISERLGAVPRYRQVVKWVPGHLANPIWVDDVDFDISYHVRRSALPRPGTDAQLRELVGRLVSRPLDRSRPLWEIYLVESVENDRAAIVTKTHHAMVDGVSAVDVGTMILDLTPEPEHRTPEPWHPAKPPSSVSLAAGAIADAVQRPVEIVDTIRGAAADLRQTARRVGGLAGGLFSAFNTVGRAAPASPLNVDIGEQRRVWVGENQGRDNKRGPKGDRGKNKKALVANTAGGLRGGLFSRGGTL